MRVEQFTANEKVFGRAALYYSAVYFSSRSEKKSCTCEHCEVPTKHSKEEREQIPDRQNAVTEPNTHVKFFWV